MELLEVEVENTGTGNRSTRRFDRLPVRIGRSPSCNLVIDAPWVSATHGVLTLESGVIQYCDLRSRNGTSIEGKNGRRQAPPNEPVVLEDGDRLFLGVVVVTVRAVVAEAPPDPAALGQSSPHLGTKVMSADQARQFAALANQGPQPVGPSPTPSGLAAPGSAPTPSGQSSPSLSSATPARIRAAEAALAATAPAHMEPAAAMVGALTSVADAFARGFLELRRSHEEFAREVGIRPVSSRTRLGDLKEPTDVIRYLVDEGRTRPDRLAELQQLFSDLILHEVALLAGLREGVRALIDDLDPEGSFKEKEVERGGIRIFENRLERYAEYFKEMTEDDGQSHIFGSRFAAAYMAASGSRKV